jgi:hypothetical protein
MAPTYSLNDDSDIRYHNLAYNSSVKNSGVNQSMLLVDSSLVKYATPSAVQSALAANSTLCNYASKSTDPLPWLTIDLGLSYPLYMVQIWFSARSPFNGSLQILLGDDPGPPQGTTSTSMLAFNPACYSETSTILAATYVNYNCGYLASGRYLTVQRTDPATNSSVMSLVTVLAFQCTSDTELCLGAYTDGYSCVSYTKASGQEWTGVLSYNCICTAGYFQKSWGSGLAVCARCSPGTYWPSNNPLDPSQCSITGNNGYGIVCNNWLTAQDNCTLCASGTYTSDYGSTSCTACPAGLVSAPGATSIASCITATPTKQPTSPTTVLPSMSPTKLPSKAPSHAPSTLPSLPSQAPTIAPSSAPSQAPTLSASSQVPTIAPTSAPYRQPSLAPTRNPTAAASGSPSAEPISVSPSATPTSRSPTSSPSASPTSQPTSTPTATPTTARSTTVLPSRSGPTTVPTTATVPTATPTLTLASSLVVPGFPINVQVLGSVRGFQGVANKRIDYNLMYTIDGSSSSIATSVNTDGSSNLYFSFAPILLMQGKTLSFTVSIVSAVSAYTCYLNMDTQSISYPSSGSTNISSTIFSSVVLTTCAASGSGGVTIIPQSGISSINTTGLNPETFIPGTAANIDFTSTVGNGISSSLGVSNNSILVDVCFDAANRPQLCIVFLADAASSSSGANSLVCSRAGQSITIPISVSSISHSNNTNSNSSNVTFLSSASTVTSSTIPFSLILPEFNSPLSQLANIGTTIILLLPIYGAVLTGVAIVLFVIMLYLLFRRYTPKAKILPIFMFFFNWLVLSADLSFLAYLNTSRKPLVDSLGCPQEHPLASTALLLLLLGVFFIVSAAIFGWYVSFRMMWHSCSKNALNYYASSRDLLTGNPTSRSHHHFTRFKLKHKVAIVFVCVCCGLIGPAHMPFLASRFCGAAAFKCNLPEAAIRRIKLWELILLFGYNLPFSSLGIAASVLLSGWKWQIIASLVFQLVLIMLHTAKFALPICVKHFECAKKMKNCIKNCDKCVKKSPNAIKVVPSGVSGRSAAAEGVFPVLKLTSKRAKFRQMAKFAKFARESAAGNSQIPPAVSAQGVSADILSYNSSNSFNSDSDSDSDSSNTEASEHLEIASNPVVLPTNDSSPQPRRLPSGSTLRSF